MKRPRLLPCAVVAMALLGALKAALLVGAAVSPSSSRQAGPTARFEVIPAAHASPSPAGTAAPSHGPGATAAAAHAPVPPPPAPPPVVPAPPSEPPVSEAERVLLQDLRARRAELDRRDQAMAGRENLVAAAERRLAARVEELAQLQARLEALEGTRRERDEANWRGLVRTYEIMRPRDAATIWNDLDMPVLLQVLDRMKESKAAPILAAMQPDRARQATAQLAQMRTRAVTVPAPGAAPAATPPSAPAADGKSNS